MPWVVGYDEGWSEDGFHFSNGGEAKSTCVLQTVTVQNESR